jgi:hypothetical protein
MVVSPFDEKWDTRSILPHYSSHLSQSNIQGNLALINVAAATKRVIVAATVTKHAKCDSMAQWKCFLSLIMMTIVSIQRFQLASVWDS